MFKKRSQSGSSLIEVVLITVIVASVLTALAASISMSSKNTNENKKRSLATSFVQETLEVFYRERYALGWSSFHSALSSGVYCLNTLPVDSISFVALSPGACSEGSVIVDTPYKREATVTVSVAEVKVESTVSWFDGNSEKNVVAEQTFREID